MAPRNSPTVWRRWLAAELKALREAKGLHQKDVGRECGWSGARLSYLEHGQQVPTEDDLDQLLPLYGVDPESAPKFYEAVKFAREKGWWERVDERDMPDYLRDFVGLEQGASLIRVVEPYVVPGLLQTREYIVHMLRGDVVPRADRQVARIADLRLARQGVLTDDDPAELQAVVDESVLHRVVGGPETMAHQLEHLASMAARPNVSLRVFPFEGGTHSAMVCGYRILTFSDESSVLYLEHREGAAYHEQIGTVENHVVVYNDLSDRALSPDESLTLLEAMTADYASRSRRLSGTDQTRR